MQKTADSDMAELMHVPGVGEKMAGALRSLDCCCPEDLAGRDPEELYERLCALRGEQVDRCVLYVFRCAVYYASNREHDPELLKWWNWKDSRLRAVTGSGRSTGC